MLNWSNGGLQMQRLVAIAVIAIVAGALGFSPARSAPPEEKGKICRVEQQCHWENFKKVCVYVKVCR
jgi:hypothetical protein